VYPLSEHDGYEAFVGNSDLDQLPTGIVTVNHGPESFNPMEGRVSAMLPIECFYPVVRQAFLPVYRNQDFNRVLGSHIGDLDADFPHDGYLRFMAQLP
jgi:hypothetical protein